jgi:hypothetical protein
MHDAGSADQVDVMDNDETTGLLYQWFAQPPVSVGNSLRISVTVQKNETGVLPEAAAVMLQPSLVFMRCGEGVCPADKGERCSSRESDLNALE